MPYTVYSVKKSIYNNLKQRYVPQGFREITMKRVWNIVMVSLVLLIWAKPTIAMHYCHDTLLRVSIEERDSLSCCGKATEDKDVESQLSFRALCCTLDTVELEVDEFSGASNSVREQSYTTDYITNNIYWVVDGFGLNNLQEQSPTTVEQYSPAQGLYPYDISIHSLNCVFII